ncbi:MAG TPA: methyltransferase domain-containing protein [Bacillota bacterium]|nr:methyltransferase domain-containing protein [Bacillota bacterium]
MTEKEILNLDEASELFQVSTKTLLKMLREEAIPARKIGREWRFARAALLHWIATGNSMNYTAPEEDNKAYFTEMAPVYDELRMGFYGNALRDLIIERYPPDLESSVADIGTGTGYLARGLAAKAGRVTAVDSSTAMLEVAGMELVKEGIHNVQLIEGDAYDLPLPDLSQEIVYANLLMHHLAEPVAALREIFRILKPGGRAVITDVKDHGYSWVKDEKFDVWMGFNPEDIREWFEESDFRNIELIELGCNCRTSNRAGVAVEIPMFLATGLKAE